MLRWIKSWWEPSHSLAASKAQMPCSCLPIELHESKVHQVEYPVGKKKPAQSKYLNRFFRWLVSYNTKELALLMHLSTITGMSDWTLIPPKKHPFSVLPDKRAIKLMSTVGTFAIPSTIDIPFPWYPWKHHRKRQFLSMVLTSK